MSKQNVKLSEQCKIIQNCLKPNIKLKKFWFSEKKCQSLPKRSYLISFPFLKHEIQFAEH